MDSDLFSYIITNQYLFDKFYRIIIDTNTSKHYIASYGQYLLYTKDVRNTIIDIAKASAIYIQFCIDSILSIRFFII